MRRRFAIYPTRAPRSPREPRPGRRGLSEAEVRATLYGLRWATGNVTPLGSERDRLEAWARALVMPEDLAGPWR